MADQDTSGGMFPGFANPESDLNKLTGAWGITFSKGRVLHDPAAATGIRAGDGQPVLSASWLSLRNANMSSNDIAVGGLDRVMMPFAGHFTGKPVDGLGLEPLILASGESGTTDSFAAQRPGEAVDVMKSAERPIVALRLKGRFKSAFPDGKPGETNAAAAVAGHLAVSTNETAVVLVGDVDMLADRNCVAPSIFGGQYYEMINDNITLCFNLVEQLSGSDVLIGLRSRGSYARPFDHVISIEAAAQQRWQAEELELQKKLEEAQSRISELQARKDPSQKLVVTPEQQAEIAKFRAQVVDTRKQLREVRKNLRQDIEALGMKIKVLNIAAVPAAVAALGILLGLRRRAKAIRP
jgi:ABC-type uncharacterized transport system involved in gliding motility auxiliary subunit